MAATVRLLERAKVRALTRHLPRADATEQERKELKAAAAAVRAGVEVLTTEEATARRSEDEPR